MILQRSSTVVGWILLLTGVLTAAPPSDWTAVAALPPGALVRVESSSEAVQSGKFVGADSRKVTLTVSGRAIDIPRASVRRLYRVLERKVGRSALRGLEIGAAAGATLGAVAAETNKGQISVLLALGWGTVGAVVGALSGVRRDRLLMYEAPTL